MKRVPMLLFVFAAGAIVGHFLTPTAPPGGSAGAPLERASDEPPSNAEIRTEDLAPEDLTGTARLEGRRTDEEEADAAPRVTPDGRVRTRVLVFLPDGSMPPEATVYWTDDPDKPLRGRRHMTWKPTRMSAYIPPGDCFLLATAGVRESLKSETVRIHVSARGDVQEVRLEVEERAGIHGRVVLPGVFDRPNIKVQLRRREADVLPEDHAFGRDDADAHPRTRDGYGFAFHDLEPGDYVLGLSLGYDTIVLTEAVRVETSMVEQDLVLEAFDPKRYMEVTVLSPGGRRIEDAQISIHFSGDRMSVGGGNVQLLRDDGAFVVDHSSGHTLDEDGELMEGRYTIHVRTDACGEIIRPYDPRTTTSLTIRAGEEGSLVIRVVDLDPETAPEGLTVAARQAGERGLSNPKPIGPDREIDFGERPPGTYEIAFLVGPRMRLRGVKAIEFRGDEDTIEVPAPTFHRLLLRLPEDSVEPVFSLRRRFGPEQWSYHATRDDSGNLVFEHLTEGTYSLEGHVGERWIKREVHVPAETEIRLD